MSLCWTKKTKDNRETTPGPGHSAGQIGLLVPPYLALRAWHVQGCAFKRKHKKIPKPLFFSGDMFSCNHPLSAVSHHSKNRLIIEWSSFENPLLG